MNAVLNQLYSGHRGPVYALVDWKGDILSGSGDGLVARWRPGMASGGDALVNVGQAVFALGLIAPQELLLIGTEGGDLHLVDLSTRREVQRLSVHRRGIFRIAVLPGGRIACAGGDGTLSTWLVQRTPDGPALTLLRQIPLCEGKLRDAQVCPAGRELAVACGDGTVRVLDVEDLNERLTLHAHVDGATSVAWHPGKAVLLSGGKDGHMRAWRSADGGRVMELPAHRGGIYALAFDTDARLLASASRDRTAKLWNAGDMAPLARLDRQVGGHGHSVNHLCWLDGMLFTAGDDRMVNAWSVDTIARHGR